MSKKTNTAIALITTALAGVVSGLLAAPQTGKEARKGLKKLADSTVKDLQTKGKEFKNDAKKKTDQFKKNLTN